MVSSKVSQLGELAHEQGELDTRYARLDSLSAETRKLLDKTLREQTTNHQGRSERDILAHRHQIRLNALLNAEERLCFARLDFKTGQSHYLGRIAITDEASQSLLVDWRAPVAASFYQATWKNPMGVCLRRHILTQGRKVTSLDDDALTDDTLDGEGATALVGGAALFGAITRSRTGRMHDIVSSIQSDQDRIIRSDPKGVLVVQGGPGTGKTAVALHRAAWLLYTHREKLNKSGVLILSPTPLFSRYISNVLPSLGETGAVTSTVGQLFPGIDTDTHDVKSVAKLKGDLVMSEVLSRVIASHQRHPQRVLIELTGRKLTLTARDIEEAYERTYRKNLSYNQGRVTFLRILIKRLTRKYLHQLGEGRVPDPEILKDVTEEIYGSVNARRELNLLWMPLTPQRILEELYTREDIRTLACEGLLTDAERDSLTRPKGFACSWTCEDVALLDEAAELLGEDTTEKDREEAREKAERKELLSYAKEAMNGMGLGRGFFTAQALADRWQEEAEVLTVAEQAEADRSWVYGHIIADEAQELSPMVWRILMRRCPSRSMTLVGDTDQASSANPVCSWKETLEQYASGRYRVEALTVNYRTPSQMMDLASRMLKESGRIPGGVESVREAEVAPRFLEYGSLNFEDLAAVLTAELDLLGAGRLAVVLPSIPGAYKLPCPRDVASGLSNILGPGVCESGASGLDVPVVVLTAEQVKGLEFDSVVVVDPLSIYELAPSDLYVTTTRPTQRLTILHPGSLPPGYGA